jgi:hypothetical protein
MKLNTALLLLFTAVFGSMLCVSAVAQTGTSDHRITPDEAKTLLKTASTPEDHLKLAEFYRQEARDEAAAARAADRPVSKVAEQDLKKAAEQEKMAEMMQSTPQPTRAHPSR